MILNTITSAAPKYQVFYIYMYVADYMRFALISPVPIILIWICVILLCFGNLCVMSAQFLLPRYKSHLEAERLKQILVRETFTVPTDNLLNKRFLHANNDNYKESIANVCRLYLIQKTKDSELTIWKMLGSSAEIKPTANNMNELK